MRTPVILRCRCASAIAAAVVMATLAAPALAQDRADIDRTQIIGNRELPKVLYIVPWKKPLAGDLSNRPLESVLDEVMAPVDRDVFRRQMRYDSVIQSRTAAASAAAAGAAAKPGK
jgi:hypothetical protein